jgi:quinohemoprotein ethanol dehydrogenase
MDLRPECAAGLLHGQFLGFAGESRRRGLGRQGLRGAGDGRLVAIDAAKGTQLWSSQVVDPALNGISGAPRVAAGKVFIGDSGSDEQVRGSIAAFDAETGKQVWRFWTVPGDPARGFESKALELAAKTWIGDQ